jgi:hypothetical protein
MRRIAPLAITGLAAGVLVVVCALHADDLGAALDRLPLLAVGGATLLHALTLVARGEAWRLSLRAADGPMLDRRAVHGASAGAFVAGSVSSHFAMPVRIALLRPLSRDHAPGVRTVLLADAPILALEIVVATSALAVGLAFVPLLPWWLGPCAALAAVGFVVALRMSHLRFEGHPLVTGLAILGRRRERIVLAALVAAIAALTLTRVWLLLSALDLPHDPPAVALVFVAMGVLGLLPLGPASGPGATLVVLGATSATAAAAAGIAVSATSILAVGVYALAVGGAQCCAMTRSMRPYSTASSALKKRSRSMSSWTRSSGWPVWRA